ncbi:polyisoprenoid-binding protein YceI [Paenibacillus phyllosphaerae]|uniref:Polyisoprenoid-binding protein YceI n=1 Tax=Paenibacillus phyllosphaerae TaxID=274593 RepID=A0A7W5AZ34_9BACL|nr:YceI family protein [Paenibacillus phyllosphaerae]MBB3110751.1 polyisoprenoid-binding protein YceI [Paenibacillus phyllosphaerae]
MAKWTVDTAHSSVDFSVKHMMIAKVKGSFHQFSADIEADPADLSNAAISFKIDLASVDTRNADRDAHLRNPDFFNVETYPELVFQATKITKTDDGEYDVTGNVSLHGVTKEETFEVSFEGTGKDPWGNAKVGFSAKGSLKRSDYGLTYNAALETGGVLIGDEVKFTLDIEAIAGA